MKFETQLETLKNAAATAARFVERKANLPVLSCVLLTLEGSRLTIRATNLECGVEIVIPAKVVNGGVVAVPAAVLAGFLSNTRGKTVSAQLVGEVFKIETERASASIKTLPHEDFPVLPRVSAEKSFTVKAADFVRAIHSVAYCASLSAIKPELQSVLLYGNAGKLTAVATDSFRLAEKQIPLRSGGTVPEMLLPARNAAELMRILEGVGGDVEFYYNDNQLSTQTDGTYYTSRLLDGTFPNYRQILPKTFTTEAVVLREDMATALKSLSVFADKFAQVSLAIEPAKKAMLLTSRNPDVGEQISTVKAAVEGDSVAVSFNGRYLADSLQAVGGDSVRLHSNGPGKAMLIKDASDDSFLYLAMPMNR
ncbi:DNA polymerase III subunit beta [Candidatus Kaiserbacteria bacterium]|nr:DNA polymerase III subunit beta [Candidatus Kaiserbacteria bacterium]